MKNMKIYQKSLKVIQNDNYCTDFMFLVVMVCATHSSTISSFIILNFHLIFKISILFVEIYVYRF